MTPATFLLDTSAAVPLLVATHPAHGAVARWAAGRDLGIPAHACAETYAVLTRLPSDARFAPLDAAEVITRRFVDVVTLPDADASTIHARFAEVGIVGGAVYDGLVALTAIVRGLPLATRDQRARPTYAALGIQPIVLAAA